MVYFCVIEFRSSHAVWNQVDGGHDQCGTYDNSAADTFFFPGPSADDGDSYQPTDPHDQHFVICQVASEWKARPVLTKSKLLYDGAEDHAAKCHST